MRALAVALAFTAGAAGAQERVSDESREQFRLCRAALFHHVQPGAGSALFPREAAEALMEQVSFVMFETISNTPQGSIDEQRASLAFVEEFFLSFGRTLAQQGEALRDVATRERLLARCQPFIWRLVKVRIENLMQWRERAADAPPLSSALEQELKGLRERAGQAP